MPLHTLIRLRISLTKNNLLVKQFEEGIHSIRSGSMPKGGSGKQVKKNRKR